MNSSPLPLTTTISDAVHVFLQGDLVKCMLLAKLDGRLRDVSTGFIAHPQSRMFHNKPMPDDVFRVSVDRVLPSCSLVDPPFQPHQATTYKHLGDCHNWPLLWPKSQIRVRPQGTTTPSPTLPTAPTAPHGKAVAAAPDYERIDMAMGQTMDDDDEADYMDTAVDVDAYINTGADGLFMPSYGKSYARQSRDPAAPSTCTQRLNFSSQETPPPVEVPQTQPAKARVGISPGTLHKVANETIAIPLVDNTKKGRKRNKGPTKKAQARPPLRDEPPPPKGFQYGFHRAGVPMLDEEMLKAASGTMRSLHDSVLYIEQDLLKEKKPRHPVFVVKVPADLDFVLQNEADMFFVRFEDIYKMLHLKRMHHTLVRLYSLKMAYLTIKDKTPGVAIVDPFYMRESIMRDDPRVVVEYLQDFMLKHKREPYLLMPYFPE